MNKPEDAPDVAAIPSNEAGITQSYASATGNQHNSSGQSDIPARLATANDGVTRDHSENNEDPQEIGQLTII
jgi:hypothetical protein